MFLGETAMNYVNRFKGILDTLETVGQPVTEETAVCLILSGLHSQFEKDPKGVLDRMRNKTISELSKVLQDIEDGNENAKRQKRKRTSRARNLRRLLDWSRILVG